MRRAGDFTVEKDNVGPAAGGSSASAALVATELSVRSAPASSRTARPDAAFLAHLIATAEQAPQTRALRRADAADVDAAYRAASSFQSTTRITRVA